MFPSEWATCDIKYGNGTKPLYCPDSESLTFYKSYDLAIEAACKDVTENGGSMAVMHVTKIVSVKAVEIQELA